MTAMGRQIAADLRAGPFGHADLDESIVRELLSDQPPGGTDDGRSDP